MRKAVADREALGDQLDADIESAIRRYIKAGGDPLDAVSQLHTWGRRFALRTHRERNEIGGNLSDK